MKNLLVVVNSDDCTIPASATFIKAHIEAFRRDFSVTTLLGNPGKRKLAERGRTIQSQKFLARLFRKAVRAVNGDSVRQQDTRSLVKLIKKEKIDCVFAEFGMSGVGVARACEITITPLIVHFHGYDAYRKDILEEYDKDYNNLFRIAMRIIVVSQDMYRALHERFGHYEKIILNPCGANFNLLKKLNTSNKDRNQIISVGRLTPKKDPLGTIKAFHRVTITYPSTNLIMIGDGELYHQCSELIKELNLTNNIVMLGWLDHEEVLKKVAQSKIFIMNSVTAKSGDKEGTPVSLMEAMALKTIPIATYHGGIPDIISDGVNGFLYEEMDYERLSSLIEKAITLDHPEIISERAYIYSVQNLDLDSKNQNLVSIIKECTKLIPTILIVL